MELYVKFYTSLSGTEYGKIDNYKSGDSELFRWFKNELKASSDKNGYQFADDFERKKEYFSNSQFSKRYGGGQEILTTIETISLFAGTIASFIEILKTIRPIINDYFKKAKSNRKITISYDDKTIVIEDIDQLEKTIETLDKLEKGKKKKKKHKNSN